LRKPEKKSRRSDSCPEGIPMRAYLLYAISLIFIFLNWEIGNTFYEYELFNVIFYIVLPLLLAHIMGFKREELGFKWGNKEGYMWALAFFLLTLPSSFYAAHLPSFKDYYPIFSYSSWADFILKELLVGVGMFAHEAFYRGILLFPLAKKNKWLAILAQNIPYTLVHIGKPPLEVPFAFIAGIVFAEMDLRSESFLPSFLLHWLGSVVFDILCIIV